MIIAYRNQDNFQPQSITLENSHLLEDATWIDLIKPSRKEEKLVENLFALEIPTRAEMREIEPSNRLYREQGAIFMTATMVAKSASTEPKSDAVTMIVKDKRLITVRYIEPQAFSLFISRLPKLPLDSDGTYLVIELLETVIDRLADILEKVGKSLDRYSKTIFRTNPDFKSEFKINYKNLMQEIGINGDLNTKIWESLVSFNRLTAFFIRSSFARLDAEHQSRLEDIAKDIKALSDHVQFFVTKVNFLLDATLGMVNIDQNDIIKMFSIAAVILLPPTLIASIYGMNFEFLPELKWRFGYPFSIMLMFISAWIPWRYFKSKGWF